MSTPRWFTETKPGHSRWYVEHFRRLIEAARTDHPGPRWIVADLSELDLSEVGETDLSA